MFGYKIVKKSQIDAYEASIKWLEDKLIEANKTISKVVNDNNIITDENESLKESIKKLETANNAAKSATKKEKNDAKPAAKKKTASKKKE